MSTKTSYPIPRYDNMAARLMPFVLPSRQFLCLTQGLASSGKTTWAEWTRDATPGVTVVCRDYIRADIQAAEGGRLYDPKRERRVALIRDTEINAALALGHSVIVADTNLYAKTIEGHRKTAERFGVEFCINDTFIKNVSVEECIKRDQGRPGMVGKDVIERQYYDWWAQQPKPENKGWGKAIMVDLDGTLALIPPGANKYVRDFTHDILNENLATILRLNLDHEDGSPFNIIFMSGREDTHVRGATHSNRAMTELWLSGERAWFGPYDLYMRPEGDRRPDTVVKKELYMKHVQGKKEVVAVFDDRPSVVRMWRAELGLTCFQVAPNLEF